MADPTQDAHTTRVKDLLPSGELDEITGDVTPTESSTTLWKRRRRAIELVRELEGLEKAQGYSNQFLQQAWMNAGGTMPDQPAPGLSEITGDTVTSAPSGEDFRNMLNKAEFTTALEQGLVSAREADQVRIAEEEKQALVEAAKTVPEDANFLERYLAGRGKAALEEGERIEATSAGVATGLDKGTFGIAWGELVQSLAFQANTAWDTNAMDIGPGAGERRKQRIAGLEDNELWRWTNNEISDEMFVNALTNKVHNASFLEEGKWALFSPSTYIVPLPVIDQIAGFALKTGLKTASQVARLSVKLSKAGLGGTRDLISESFESLATWAPGRAGVAEAQGPVIYGPYGEGQFRLNPGPVSVDDTFTIQGASRSPYEIYVNIRKGVASGLTNVRRYTTDHFAWSKNLENEIKRYWEKANPGKAFPAGYKFATKLALTAGGVHHRAGRRYQRWQDEIGKWLVTAEGQRMDATYAMRLSDLMHQYDILGMHPGRAQEGVWTQDIIMRQVDELREEVSRKYQRGPRHRGEITSWERVTNAADVISRAYKEMLNEKVMSGFYSREFADYMMDLYPHYHPVKHAEHQLFEGIEIQIDPSDTIGQMGQRLAGPNDPTMQYLANTAQTYDLDNPLEVLRGAVLRHEKQMQLNDIVKSLVKALRVWEWDSVTREGQLIKTFEFDRPVTTTGGRALGETPAGVTGAVDTPVEEAAGAVAEVRTRSGSDVAVRVPRPRAPYSTAHRAATQGRAKVVYWENGKPVYVEVDANVAKDIQTLITMPTSAIRTYLRTIQFPWRAIWTQYNPGFMIKNFMFEMLTNMVVHGVMPQTTITNLMKAFKSIAFEDELIERMYDSNAIVLGRTGERARRDTGKQYIFSRTTKTGATRIGPTQRQIQEGAEWTIRDSKDWKRFLFNDSGTFNPLKLFNLLNEAAGAFEMAPRMALFQKGLERGLGEQGAASLAREGMVDFAQAGILAHNLDAVFLYLNAGIQGAKVPFVAFSKNPKKVGMSLAMIPGLAFGQYQYNRWVTNQYKDTDLPNNWNDIPAEDRYGAISFLLPGPGKRMSDGSVVPRYIKIVPILRELALPWGGSIRLFETMEEKVPNDMQAFFEATQDQIWPLSSVLPNQANAGITDGGLDIPMVNRIPYPTELGETIASLFANKDPFTGRDIVDKQYSDPNIPKGERSTPWTSEVANNVARFSGGILEPSQVDHLFKAGGLANSLIEGVDMALRKAGLGRKTPQVVSKIVAELDSFNDILPDQESIRIKQNSYRANLDWNLFKDDPELIAANITNKKAFLDEIDAELRRAYQRDKKPWTNPIDAFVGTGGYGRYSTAKKEALKKAGYDDAETRAAAEDIADLRITLNQSQLELDRQVTDGNLSRLEWRQQSNNLAMMMRFGLIGIFEEFPKAMQAGRGTLGFNEYMDGVNTLMGRWPDDRSRGEVLYDLWLGVLPDLYEGSDNKTVTKMADDNTMTQMLIEDMRPLWNAKDKFISSLSEDDQELLAARRSQYDTPLQKAYEHALELLMPYYNFQDQVHAGIANPIVREAFSKRMSGTHAQKKAVEKEAIEKGFIRELMEAEALVEQWRDEWLRIGYDDAEQWDAEHASKILVGAELAKMPQTPSQLLMLWELASPKFSGEDEEYQQDLISRVNYEDITWHEPWVEPGDAITTTPSYR